MSTFPASVWDRLTEPVDSPAAHGPAARLTLAQYQRAIARDLEALLNTNIAIPEDELQRYPGCKNSIVNFGLADFAQLCLGSSDDRQEICERLKAAIERHEPRLSHVRADLADAPGTINRLSFAISAQLRALGEDEPVRFDVLLEPSNLHYSIR